MRLYLSVTETSIKVFRSDVLLGINVFMEEVAFTVKLHLLENTWDKQDIATEDIACITYRGE